jgi:2-polyprenyl-3-methyl-5-hydroxy-6-metoxy-1,4-benzoquinol methylase
MSAYAFDNRAAEAGTQLDCLQLMLDRHTLANLTTLSLPQGGRCWEIGAGAGSIATWMATTVGSTGYVLATDIDVSQLQSVGGLHVVEHDITDHRAPDPDLFDVIHARLVLLHLPQRRDILSRLVAALCPGGYLMLEEFDCDRPLQVLTSATADDANLFTRVHTAILTTLTDCGASRTWAYQAYAAMIDAGLTDVTTVTNAESACADSPQAFLHDVNTRQLQPRLEELGVRATDLDAFRSLMHDPAFTAMSYPLVSTWGRRPR